MDDSISRQAAIDAIRASASKYTGFMEMEMYTDDDAVEAINDVPAAQQWIPCDERLPEKDGRYLVTNDGWGKRIVDWNAWLNGQWLYNSEPIAWMPLPEPYQGGEK